jgi:uncharacterized oligopeptide transporter (OPT) family protein
MLGAKPRQQAIGHLLGAVSGLSLSVPIWYYVFIQGDVSRYGSDRLPVPGAITWKAVAQLLMTGLHNLAPSAQVAVLVGAAVGIVVEVSKQVSKNRFPLSAVGLGLAFVLSFHDIWVMFLGSFVFWMLERKSKRWEDAQAAKAKLEEKDATYRKAPAEVDGKRPWFAIAAENTEAICAGVIAGGALMGIGINVLDVLVFPEVKEAAAFAPLVKHAVEALKMVN